MKPGERRVMRAAERTAETLDLRAKDGAAFEAVAAALAPVR
jgi:hypothetical protein